jgi:tetrahydromethanopterin S-methyltransferase subunit G
MDPQLDQRLSAIEKKLDETNAMIAKINHAQVVARNRKYVYWGIVIAISIISFYSVMPYISQLKEAYSVGDTTTSTNTNYGDLLKTLTQ